MLQREGLALFADNVSASQAARGGLEGAAGVAVSETSCFGSPELLIDAVEEALALLSARREKGEKSQPRMSVLVLSASAN